MSIKRHWPDLLLSCLATLAAVVGFLLWNLTAARLEAFPGRGISNVASLAKPASYPAGFGEEARRVAALSPLNQERFNAFYTFEASRSANKLPSAAMRQALAGLGWRYTPAQINLLYVAAVSGDYGMLLRRADGLLRRGVASSEAMDILYYLEGDAQFRQHLIATLATNPIWREPFFVNDHGYSTPRAVDARAATAAEMFAAGHALSRKEMAPYVSRLLAMGRGDQAYALWRRVSNQGNGASLLSDADFRHAAEAQALAGNTGSEGGGDNDRLRSPFEWRLFSGLGFDASVGGYSGAAALQIRWDGNGLPVFLSQRFRARPGRYVLRLLGSDARPDLLARLSFNAVCGDVAVGFDHLIPTEDGTLVVAADREFPCDFPEFRISARLGEGESGGFEISLTSIELVKG